MMTAHARREEARALRLNRQQAADLLQRYPEVSDAETHQVLTFLRTGRHLDVGMLTADRKLKPKLDRFMDDHAHHLRVSFVETAALIAAIVAFLALCWLLWEAFGLGG
jgi:hypothetical protein